MNFAGQTLDGKYHIERELGRGGMGTVYLAAHLGTERPVAVKIISPQFMERSEFIERFRREARAAGRLRHPNVVNVTDFGFADTKDGQVAYLVMEYLDGCTLGEILDEEKNLPVGWTLDIIDQVCSAVHEAHLQGIIHRDLKPDNIWLEPNQRGGYTVKVLDFGIAKLEEHGEEASNGEMPDSYGRSTHTLISDARATFAGADPDATRFEGIAGTQISEKATIVQAADHATLNAPVQPAQAAAGGSENRTAIMTSGEVDKVSASDQDTVGTKLISGADENLNRTTGQSLYDRHSSAELTRVGAVLGTPLYMSPEQCRGEQLDQRSDIYSLGVIAYQMLSGSPPFEGDFKDVMESHKSVEPPPLKAKGIRRKLKTVIHRSMAKDPDNRPVSAEAFASELRSRSEGIGELLRRALVIYSEHLPKFLLLTAFFEIPVILLTLSQMSLSFLRVSGIISETVGKIAVSINVLLLTLASAFCATLVIGSIVWIVSQYLAVPLRPVRLRPALNVLRRKWKRVAATGALAALTPFVATIIIAVVAFAVFGGITKLASMATGFDLKALIVGGVAAFLFAIAGFFRVYVACMLVTPTVMMESLRIREAFRRSRQLTNRAFATSLAATMIMFLIPMFMAGTLTFIVHLSAKALDPPKTDTAVVTEAEKTKVPAAETAAAETSAAEPEPDGPNVNISLQSGTPVKIKDDKKSVRERVKMTALESVINLFWLPLQILLLSFSGVIGALLYLKTRLAGGESMTDLIERFEDDGRPRKKWQERVRQRLIRSGRIPSKS